MMICHICRQQMEMRNAVGQDVGMSIRKRGGGKTRRMNQARMCRKSHWFMKLIFLL